MKRVIPLIVILAVILAGCSAHSTQKPEKTLKIGVLPIEDSLPIYVAKENGLYKKYGLNVQIIEFNSALERDAALISGKVDAVITDPLAVILLNNRGYDIKIVTMCLGLTPSQGVFAILAAPNSSIHSVKDLNGKTIGISSNTIIEYVTDMLLSRYHIKYKKVDIKQIPIRLRMLLDGKIDAACLPEPLASYAVAKGARLIISDAMVNESLTQTVIAFRGDYIKKHRDAVKAFLKAYGEAVKLIDENPQKYKPLLVKIARVPKEIAEKYPVPKFPEPMILPKKFYERYLTWAEKKGLIKKPIPYNEVICNLLS